MSPAGVHCGDSALEAANAGSSSSSPVGCSFLAPLSLAGAASSLFLQPLSPAVLSQVPGVSAPGQQVCEQDPGGAKELGGGVKTLSGLLAGGFPGLQCGVAARVGTSCLPSALYSLSPGTVRCGTCVCVCEQCVHVDAGMGLRACASCAFLCVYVWKCVCEG